MATSSAVLTGVLHVMVGASAWVGQQQTSCSVLCYHTLLDTLPPTHDVCMLLAR
jgi:hypothetical protein